MGVHVDPAGRHHQPAGIDLSPGRSLLPADGGDPAFCDGNVAAEGGLAGAIDDRAATNDDVVHANLPPGSRRQDRAVKSAPSSPRRQVRAETDLRSMNIA